MSYRQFTGQIASVLRGLEANIEMVKGEGRNAAWTREAIDAAVKKAGDKVADNQVERKVFHVKDGQAIKKMVTRGDKFNERTYHVNRGAAATQGLDDAGLLKFYNEVVNDSESFKYKAEYEDVIKPKLSQEGEIEFNELRNKYLTQEEKQQAAESRGHEAWSYHLQMLTNHEKEALTQIGETGKANIDLDIMLTGALEGVEKAKNGGAYK